MIKNSMNKTIATLAFVVCMSVAQSAHAFIIYPGIVFDWGFPISCSDSGVLVNYTDMSSVIQVQRSNSVVSSFVISPTTAISYVAPVTVFENGEAISYSGWEDTATGQCVATSVTVAPVPVPVATLTASPVTVYVGSQSTLTASCTNATSASIDNGVGSFTSAAGGTKAVFPAVTTTYTLTCTGAGGASQKSVTVTAVPRPPVPTASLTASPSTITKGGSSTLSAVCTNSTLASINNAVGAVPAAGGSKIVAPTVTTTYTLTCSGAGGTSVSSAKITVGTVTSPTTSTVSSALKAEGKGVVTSVTASYAVINGVRLEIVPTTILKSEAGSFISVGLTVEYKGVKNANGTITATSIKQQ